MNPGHHISHFRATQTLQRFQSLYSVVVFKKASLKLLLKAF